MTIRVGINGFGRIGRLTARVLAGRSERFELRLVNDLADAPLLARLFANDSTYGRFGGSVEAEEGALRIDGRTVRVTSETSPDAIPWKDADVDVVLESTGHFRTREDLEKHHAAGAPRVVLSAPAKGDRPVPTVVLGVNAESLGEDDRLVSNASCTTNALVPMLYVLHEAFGIDEALVTTVHAYTPTQHLLDGIDKDPRRARSATQNIIPTTTGAAKAAVQVLPALEGRLRAMAMRVPVATGSIVDLSARLSRGASPSDVNAALRESAEGSLRGLLRYSEEPLVSQDIVADPHSCVIDGALTDAVGERAVKVLGWYDNEWAYAVRCADLMERMAGRG